MANEGLAGSSRFGQDLGSPPEEALFLKVFGGLVLLAFERKSVTNGRVMTRTITSGKSAQFPLIGAASSTYHVPGQNILQEGAGTPTYLSQPQSSEKVISIDGMHIASAMVHDIDEAMSHFDVRAPYARELGWALAKNFDLNTLWVIATGAGASATISGDDSDWGDGGTVKVSDTFHTTVADTKTELETASQTFDESDVPEHGRHFAVDPVTYYLLAGDNEVVSSDYNTAGGGTGGSVAQHGTAPVLHYSGWDIHKTNRLADLRAITAAHAEQLGTDYGTPATHLAKCRGLGWQEDWSAGVVKLRELGMRMQDKLEYLGTLMVAGYSTGHGFLHESACYRIETTT